MEGSQRLKAEQTHIKSWTSPQKGFCTTCIAHAPQNACKRKAHVSHPGLSHTYTHHRCLNPQAVTRLHSQVMSTQSNLLMFLSTCLSKSLNRYKGMQKGAPFLSNGKERKVYASQWPRALREWPQTKSQRVYKGIQWWPTARDSGWWHLVKQVQPEENWLN